MIRLIIFILTLNFFCCKASKSKCESRKTSQSIEINSFDELLRYVDSDDVEKTVVVLDSRIVSKELLEKVIFGIDENKIIAVTAMTGMFSDTFDGEMKKILVLESNSCDSRKLIKKLKLDKK